MKFEIVEDDYGVWIVRTRDRHSTLATGRTKNESLAKFGARAAGFVEQERDR